MMQRRVPIPANPRPRPAYVYSTAEVLSDGPKSVSEPLVL